MSDICWICKRTENEVLEFLSPFLNTIPEDPDKEPWNEKIQIGRQQCIESVKHRIIKSTYWVGRGRTTELTIPISLCHICYTLFGKSSSWFPLEEKRPLL